MEHILEPSRQTAIFRSCDVLVCGAGTSGFCAAIAASRNGADSILVERGGYPGGTLTQSLVMPLMTFHASLTRQVIGGIAEELVERVRSHGGSPGHLPDPLGTASTITPVDPEILKFCMVEMLRESGTHLLFHTQICGVFQAGQEIRGIFFENKSGRKAILSSVTVDATGDADIACWGGAEFVVGRSSDQGAQPMTLMFRLAGVDGKVVRTYIQDNPDEFTFTEQALQNLDSLPLLAVSGFFGLLRQAQTDGVLTDFRDRVLYFELPRAGEVIMNMTRIIGHSGLNTQQITAAQFEGYRQVYQCVRFLKEYVPGFSKAYLLETASQIGIRETRHLCGKYTLTGEDVLHGRDFADSIARGAFPIDIHSPDGSGLAMQKMTPGMSYGIPYGCMLPRDLEGIIVTGRSISATHEAAASARVSPTCMALGQAAGTAAVLASKNRISPSRIDVSELRRTLLSQGAIL